MIKHFMFVLIFCLLALAGSALAQDEFDQIYINDAQTFEVLYNDDWQVLQSDNLTVTLSGVVDNSLIMFVDAAEFGLELDGVDDLESAADVYREFIPELSDIKEIEGADREIARGTIDSDEISFNLFFVIRFDDGLYGLALLAGDPDDLVDAEAIVLTYNNVGGNDVTAELGLDQSKNYPNELENHDGVWQNAIEELQEEEVIGTGGSLVFNEDYAFFSGQGNFFTPLARNSPQTNFIMAGELTFEAGSTTDPERCVLTSRIVTNNRGSATRFLDVGITNNGNLAIIDIHDDEEDPFVDFRQLAADLDDTIHVLFIVIEDRATVYVDGELFIEDSEVDERSGTFGIALIGAGAGARCEGRNIWVYRLPNVEDGVCEVTSGSTVNKRSGPGTNFDRAGQLTAGSVEEVIARASDGSFTWWQLEDESWVREDVVTESGDCLSVTNKE